MNRSVLSLILVSDFVTNLPTAYALNPMVVPGHPGRFI
jgi:hypothetical protein